MSRYLTPSKVSLLVLVSLYCDSVVPNRAIIPILSFIVTHIVPQTAPAWDNLSSETPLNPSISIEDFEGLTITHPSSIPGRTLFDLFLRRLWSIDSLHALHTFFHGLTEYLARPNEQQQDDAASAPASGRILLSRVAPLGIFLRRAQLEFMRVPFHDAVKLWTAFVKFRAPTETIWRRKNPAAVGIPFDASVSDLGLEHSDRLLRACYGSSDANDLGDGIVSSEDIERMLEFHLDRLQRLGNRMPEDMKERFRNLVQQISTVPSLAYFVRFFDAWRAGDYSNAFENLHRYFDYTTQTRDKSYYQYALLHMAILQADFGCFSEAIAAMNETIATARENQDISCLNFSMSWLNHLGKAYPKEMKRAGYVTILNSEKESLEFLREKAKETKMWNLLSSTLLSETKLLLSAGEGIPQALEYLYQSAHLNLVHHINSNHGTQLLMQSSVYGRLGLTHLADAYCETLLDCYSGSSPVEEIVRALCRRAYSLDAVDPNYHRTLKLHQYLISYTGLLKLKRVLRKHDLIAASHILRQLQSGASSEPDLDFQVSLLEIDFLQREGSFSIAYHKIEDKVDELKAQDSDIYQRIHMLVLKAMLFSKVGKASKGFTLAMRAAAMAYRTKLLPAQWEAIGALANVLSSLEEFETARRLLDATIPQALGGGDTALCAQLYSWQADACMGLAGNAEADSIARMSFLSKAETYIDRAGNYFERIEDIRGECEMLAKKAIIARTRGDHKLAEDWATKYLTLYQKQLAEQGSEHGPPGG